MALICIVIESPLWWSIAPTQLYSRLIMAKPGAHCVLSEYDTFLVANDAFFMITLFPSKFLHEHRLPPDRKGFSIHTVVSRFLKGAARSPPGLDRGLGRDERGHEILHAI